MSEISEKAKALLFAYSLVCAEVITKGIKRDEHDKIYHELQSYIAALEAENAALKVERRWIPVSERLPDVNEDVLVYDQRHDITIDFLVTLDREGKPYYTNSDDGALFWMPLPTPPEVQE